MKKLGFLALLFGSVLTLGACGNSADNSATISSLEKTVDSLKAENKELSETVNAYETLFSTSTSSEEPEEQATNSEFKLGESATFTSGEKVTVTQVAVDDNIEMYEKEEGQHGVVVTATVENTGSAPLSFNVQTFNLYDSNDELCRFDASTYGNNIPNEIAAGKNATVVAHFISKAANPFSVTFGEATWVSE